MIPEVSERQRGLRMQRVRAMVERGTGHYGSTEEAAQAHLVRSQKEAIPLLVFQWTVCIHRPIPKAAAASNMKGIQMSSLSDTSNPL